MKKDINKKHNKKVDYQFRLDLVEQAENKEEVLNYEDEEGITQCFFENGFRFDENNMIKIEKLF